MPVTATALWWHANAAAGQKATPYTRTHVGGLLGGEGGGGRKGDREANLWSWGEWEKEREDVSRSCLL